MYYSPFSHIYSPHEEINKVDAYIEIDKIYHWKAIHILEISSFGKEWVWLYCLLISRDLEIFLDFKVLRILLLNLILKIKTV